MGIHHALYLILGLFCAIILSCTPDHSHSKELDAYERLNAAYIFNDDVLHTITIDLPEENLASIDADPAAEEYVEATLIFEGDTIEPVGLRYKGSIGSFVNCVSGEDWINPSGHKTCTKLSMKMKVDWEDSERTFYGLRKVQLHSMNHDMSQMRDRLGYCMFREMGVPSPRSTHARVVINGNYVGLFALIEQIDEQFTAHHFTESVGQLYKEIWPLDMNGVATSRTRLYDHLEGGSEDTAEVDLFHEFGKAIENTNDMDLKEGIAAWMNVDEIMAFAAVDRMIRADDGPFHWYCFNGGCAPHNFYWYMNATTGNAHLLPWDLDHAFQNMTEDKNPVTPIADAWGEITNDCKPFPYGAMNILQRSAACDKLTHGWTQFEEEYNEKVNQLMSGPFAVQNVSRLMEKWSAQIREATEEAHASHSDAITMEEWEQGMAIMMDDIRRAHRRFLEGKNGQ